MITFVCACRCHVTVCMYLQDAVVRSLGVWRSSLQPGTRLDVLDDHFRWHEAEVKRCLPSSTTVSGVVGPIASLFAFRSNVVIRSCVTGLPLILCEVVHVPLL